MPASLEHIHPGTPMGANLIAGGATFRVWAPHARAVHVIGDFNNRERNDASLLNRIVSFGKPTSLGTRPDTSRHCFITL
jgi:1,4-alpha-glucan branching enzyme